jgi:hypothetical protein
VRDSNNNLVPNYLDSLQSQGLIDKKLFSIYLSDENKNFYGESFITFGQIDESFLDQTKLSEKD